MKNSFWYKIKKPIIGLSPMDGVTDQPYRYIQKKYGNPNVIYTEFTNVEGVCHGATNLLKDFIYDETQEPIVAQIYGKTPKYFRQVSTILCQLGFSGIDINMGCPAKSVDNSGSGAALIKTPKLAQEIIKAVKQGVKDYLNGKRAKDCANISEEIALQVKRKEKIHHRNVPVSVKTRIGYSHPITNEWMKILLEVKPELISLHGRTLKQQYSGKADWEEIRKAAIICHQHKTLILGNGDIKSHHEIEEKINKYQIDGVLIGRASLGNPFIFNKDKKQKNIFEVALEHSQVFEKTYANDERYNFLPMRKHLGWYVKNISNAKIVRADLFKTNNSEEVKTILKKYNLIN